MSAPSICVSYVPPTENAQQVINKRYSVKDENGNPTETWEDIVNRVVGAIAAPETDPVDRATFIHNATELMLSRKFIPNTPCLVNAGTGHGALAGCYVLPVRDSLKGIMQTATNAALIHQTGGGTGFTFETLRPEGAVVKTHNGLASGPISFMEIFDKVTDVVKQGGVRRGANMGIMRCDHPDILRFIHAKNNQDKLTNFNISVAVTDEFMRSVERREWYQTKFNGEDWTKPVYDPTEKDDESLSYWETSELDNDSDEEKRKQGMLFAPDVWDRIIESAHKWGEPGVVFIDTVNRHNLLMASMGPITATNPCSEQALHNYNSCNLGSIDVSKFYEPALDWQTDGKVRTPEAAFNWDAFREAVYWSVRFLDNVIDACSWPLPEIEDVVKRTRPVGLGIMGFADLLLKLKIRYGSEECLRFLDVLMTQFRYNAWLASCLIGKEKGEFPEYKNNQTAYDEFLWNTVKLTAGAIGNDPMEFGECYCSAHYHPRNYEVTTIAPTGTISLVAECSSGIEPNFAWSYTRSDTVSVRKYIHPLVAKELDITFQDPHAEMILSMKKLPDYFVTAHDLSAMDHVKVLATAQEYIDNGVSKTCNGHKEDSVESVKELYEEAYKLGVKSVSYYRDGSRDGQVLTQNQTSLCPDCKQQLQITDRCSTCVSCGWGKCSV